MIRVLALIAGAMLASEAAAQSALPFDVGGPYALINHHGAPHTQVDPEGLPQLLFFGYANCPGICTAALPLMADMTDALAKRDIEVRPVMITVDPARDTVETMGPALTYVHPDFVGLTGDKAALQASYDAFSVDHAIAYEDPEYGPVYTHGSLIYLMDAKGAVLTLIPPVMDAYRASEVALKYLAPES